MLIAVIKLPVAEAQFIIDIMYSRSQTTISLITDLAGDAHKEYDAYVKYPTSFEMEDYPRPQEWELRGIGTYATISITNMDEQIVASFSLDDADLGEWTLYNVKDSFVRLPSFRSSSMSTTIRGVVLGKWMPFGNTSVDGTIVEGFKIRIREVDEEGKRDGVGEGVGPKAPMKAGET
jgi:hypothetical protein